MLASYAESSVSNLYDIHLVRIRIQHFRLNTDPDPGFDDKN